MSLTGEAFHGSWQFDSSGTNHAAYPPGRFATIGRTRAGGSESTMAWVDTDHCLHLLAGLHSEEDGSLRGKNIENPYDGRRWDVTITLGPTGQLSGQVDASDGYTDGNLTGAWGADVPPPVQA
jgi:hypothetical protein